MIVSREDNVNLYRPVTEEEVSGVLKEIQNGKAPGPDGFNFDVFKACWNIVKQDILQAQTPDRFRPIALCNVVYKIISKVVANRLKPLLPALVLGEKLGYVEGRQILNNIIQAHEVVHSLTSKKKAGMIMQLDIAKAYDKLNWNYIRKVLIAFGFDHNWVRWILALITSSSFSILINGSPSENLTLSIGLRHGDPFSPFLLILMMEGLSRAIKDAKDAGKVRGIQLSDNGQALTHQQFVNDTMLQGIPTVKEALTYKQILKDFTKASGLEFNLSKSKIFFLNTHIAIQRNISRILGFQRDSLPSKYMGVPLTAKPLHKSIWESVISKLYDNTKKWTIRSLNLAGRLVLTKFVLQSIPIFMLSAILAPKSILDQMRNIQRDFIWGKGEDKKKWVLVAWDKICKPKNHGSLGLDDLEILGKDNRRLIQDHSFWEIREGDLALFWEDRWQQEPILLQEDLKDLKAETDAKELTQARDFWDQINSAGKCRNWRNLNLREERHLSTKAERLRKMLEQRKILVSRGHDQLRWGSNNEGNFNIKEAKLILLELDPHAPNRLWQNLWKHLGWMKIKLFCGWFFKGKS
eukprot:PITA_19258